MWCFKRLTLVCDVEEVCHGLRYLPKKGQVQASPIAHLLVGGEFLLQQLFKSLDSGGNYVASPTPFPSDSGV